MYLTKHILCLILLVCLLLSFTACGTSTAAYDSDGNIVLQTSPEPTGKLVVYVPALQMDDKLSGDYYACCKAMLDAAKKQFERAYSDVELTYTVGERDAYDAYWDTMQTELLAGRGTDLVIFMEKDFADITKVMDANVFYNLDNFIAADEDFDASLYHSAVLDGGYYKGQRLYIPFTSRTFSMLTCENSVASFDMAFPAAPTFEEWAARVVAYTQTHTEAESQRLMYSHADIYSRMFLNYSGLSLLDYDGKRVTADGEALRSYMEFYKALYDTHMTRQYEQVVAFGQYTVNDRAALLDAGELLYFIGGANIYNEYIRSYVAPRAETLVLPAPVLEGVEPFVANGFCAGIRNASPNKANAYAFLKMLLSNAAQSASIMTANGDLAVKPVLLAQLQTAFLSIYANQYGAFSEPYTAEEKLAAYEDYAALGYRRVVAPAVVDILYTIMQPWVDGDKSYEECVTELENTLELYLYE